MAELPPPAADELLSTQDVPTASALPVPAAAPGWYPDPYGAPRERWWDGEAWTDATHRPVRPNMFGPAYTRSTWAGANRIARVAQFVNLGALVLILVSLLALAPTLVDGASTPLMLIIGLVALGVAGTGLTLALIALRRSPRLGAKGLAIHQVVAGSLAIFLGFVVLPFGIAALS